MKKYIFLISCMILLTACSTGVATDVEGASSTSENVPTKSNSILKGMMGTYEITNTEFVSGDGYNLTRLTLNYTNTTERPVIPNEAIQLDFILEKETDVTIETLGYFGNEIILDDETDDTSPLYEARIMSYKNIKPGATVEINFKFSTGSSSPSAIKSPGNIYLRNNTGSGINGNIFEKVIVSIPE